MNEANGEKTKHFVDALVLLVKIHGLIRNKFFAYKFENRIHELATDYTILIVEKNSDTLEYGILLEKVSGDLDYLLELLQDLCYLQILKNSPTLLETSRVLLLVRLELVKNRNQRTSKPKTEPETTIKHENKEYREREIRVVKKDRKLNQSQQKILDFIKSYPNTRTKDIIQEFNALSDRTVKRNLTELSRTGLIKKKVDNKAVYYSTVDL